MSIIFTEGFDSYAATADLIKKWNGGAGSPWAWTSNIGRNGGGGASVIAGAGLVAMTYTSTLLFGDVLTGIFHFGFYVKFTNALPSNNQSFFVLADTTSNAAGLGALAIGNSLGNGVINLFNGNGATIGTGNRNVCDGNWHWIELQLNISGSATQRWYVDNVLDFTGTQTFNNQGRALHGITIKQMNNGIGILAIDDIVVYDNTSPGPVSADFPLGPREIITLRPNGDSAVQFTPNSGGNNFSRVNEVNGDGDTSYVQDGISGDQDLYTYDDLTATPAAINGVMLNAYLENPNAGTINFQQICKSVSTQTNGTSIIAPTSYRVIQQPFGVDPNTSGAWGFSGLNAATFGIKVV